MVLDALYILAVTMRRSSPCCLEVTSIGMAAGIIPTMPELPLYAIIFQGHHTSAGRSFRWNAIVLVLSLNVDS